MMMAGAGGVLRGHGDVLWHLIGGLVGGVELLARIRRWASTAGAAPTGDRVDNDAVDGSADADEGFQLVEEFPLGKGFKAYGGNWRMKNGVLSAGPDAGARLLLEEPVFAGGEVGVEMLLADGRAGNAGEEPSTRRHAADLSASR